MKNIFIYINPAYANYCGIIDAKVCKKPFVDNLDLKIEGSASGEYRMFILFFLNEKQKPIHKAINMRHILKYDEYQKKYNKEYCFNVFKETHIKAYNL